MPIRSPAARVLVLSLGLAAPALAADGVTFGLDLAGYNGDVTGQVQTPLGGRPGTTSPGRPTFDELGINDVWAFDFNVWARTEAYGKFSFGGQLLRMDGDAVLDQDLLTRGVTFPAGTNVASDIKLDWYRATWGYPLQFEMGTHKFEILPAVGWAVLDFSYDISGGGQSASRDYLKPTVAFAIDALWQPPGPVFVKLSLFGTPPISPPLPVILSEELLVGIKLLDTDKARLELVGGIRFEQISFEDDQTVPNDIEADLGPLFTVGLRAAF